MVLMSLVKSPIARILLLWERNGALLAPHTPNCPIADISANQGIAALFLDSSKTPQWNAGTSPMMERQRRLRTRLES
jgi:hypothetical protein